MLCLLALIPLRYCAARFACKTPTWRLPAGHVARLIAVHCEEAGGRGDEGVFTGLVVLVLGRKRIRLNRKTPAQLAGFMFQFRPQVWKRLRHVGLSSVSVSIPDHKRRRGDQDDGGHNPAQVRTRGG